MIILSRFRVYIVQMCCKDKHLFANNTLFPQKITRIPTKTQNTFKKNYELHEFYKLFFQQKNRIHIK